MSSDGETRFGALVFARVRADAERVWDEIPAEDKDSVAVVVMDLAALSLRASWGEGVEEDMLHVKAQVANWGFVGQSKVQAAIKQAIKDGFAVWIELAIKAVT